MEAAIPLSVFCLEGAIKRICKIFELITFLGRFDLCAKFGEFWGMGRSRNVIQRRVLDLTLTLKGRKMKTLEIKKISQMSFCHDGLVCVILRFLH